MSLMNAFLLDPLPVDVWIALRTDGAPGSGTQDDPYDGSTIVTPQISVASITHPDPSSDPDHAYIATVTTHSDHGFNKGDLVAISGATGSDGAYWNGTFPVATVINATTFTYTLIGLPSGLSASGTLMCQRDPYRFDAAMRLLQVTGTVVTVRLGPGIFQTKHNVISNCRYSQSGVWSG